MNCKEWLMVWLENYIKPTHKIGTYKRLYVFLLLAVDFSEF